MDKKAENIEIFVTDDYTKFKTHFLQPDRRKGITQELIDSLKATGGNKYHPVLVTKDGHVIDGHRRIGSLIAAGLPIHYITMSMKDEATFMRLINATSYNWSTLQMVNHHAKQNQEYAVLEKWLERKGATLQLIILFGGRKYAQIKSGSKLNFNYDELEAIRKAGLLIGGTFGVTGTIALRAINKLQKQIKTASVAVLMAMVEKDRRAGKYDNVVFATNADRLCDILVKTYGKGK